MHRMQFTLPVFIKIAHEQLLTLESPSTMTNWSVKHGSAVTASRCQDGKEPTSGAERVPSTQVWPAARGSRWYPWRTPVHARSCKRFRVVKDPLCPQPRRPKFFTKANREIRARTAVNSSREGLLAFFKPTHALIIVRYLENHAYTQH